MEGMKDKYSATWISHSSISDYLACPRAYFLKNIYKDPTTGHKIQLVSPSLSLGVAVHEVLEGLSILPVKNRFRQSLIPAYKQAWRAVAGETGGFLSPSLEKEYYDRGQKMLNRVMDHPGPLAELAVKIKGDLPYYYLSEHDNIILCGRLDWLAYNPARQSVHIIDFKTGKNKEQASSLQLPIYLLLATNCQKYQVEKASYWYLELSDDLTPKSLPDSKEAAASILEIGQRIALARKLQAFKCPHGGCHHCQPLEKILKGQAKKVGENQTMRRDLYLLSLKPDEADLQEIL
jgi:ATP-dependent helicase/DNAse subunit B